MKTVNSPENEEKTNISLKVWQQPKVEEIAVAGGPSLWPTEGPSFGPVTGTGS